MLSKISQGLMKDIVAILFLSLCSCTEEKTDVSLGTDDLFIESFLAQKSELVTIDWVERNLVYDDLEPTKLEDLLYMFRFYENFTEDALERIRTIWLTRELSARIRDADLAENVDLVLAAVLANSDSTNFDEYHGYIVNKTSSESVEVRAKALLYLGEVATNSDLPIFERAFGDENPTPKIQAGLALMTLGTSEAYELLERKLQELSNSNQISDSQAHITLTDAYDRWRN